MEGWFLDDFMITNEVDADMVTFCVDGFFLLTFRLGWSTLCIVERCFINSPINMYNIRTSTLHVN